MNFLNSNSKSQAQIRSSVIVKSTESNAGDTSENVIFYGVKLFIVQQYMIVWKYFREQLASGDLFILHPKTYSDIRHTRRGNFTRF